MAYSCLNIVEVSEESIVEFINPCVDETGQFVSEVWDHEFSKIGETRGVQLFVFAGNDDKTVIDRFDNLAMDVYLTDSRLVFWSNRYDKGGGYSGGFSVTGWVVAGIANAASKSAAKSRSKGKVLLGHLRYEWISTMFFRKSGAFAPPMLMFFYVDDDDLIWRLILVFPKRFDVENMARTIAIRAAHYKLKMQTPLSRDDEKTLLNTSAGNMGFTASDEKMMQFSFPPESVWPAPLGEEDRPSPDDLIRS